MGQEGMNSRPFLDMSLHYVWLLFNSDKVVYLYARWCLPLTMALTLALTLAKSHWRHFSAYDNKWSIPTSPTVSDVDSRHRRVTPLTHRSRHCLGKNVWTSSAVAWAGRLKMTDACLRVREITGRNKSSEFAPSAGFIRAKRRHRHRHRRTV